jgi:hypothetical protein
VVIHRKPTPKVTILTGNNTTAAAATYLAMLRHANKSAKSAQGQ